MFLYVINESKRVENDFDRVVELDIRYEECMEYEALGGSKVQLD